MQTVSPSTGNEVEGFCGADEYFDGVIDRCVPCNVICRLDLPLEFCKINCREFYDFLLGATNKPSATIPLHPSPSLDETFTQSTTDDYFDFDELRWNSSTALVLMTAIIVTVVLCLVVYYGKPRKSQLQFCGFTICRKQSSDVYADDKLLIDKKNMFF
jgi:hypothetical protein